MLQHILVFAAIVFLSSGEVNKTAIDSIKCYKAETPFDYDSVIGRWRMIATIEPEDKPYDNTTDTYNCLTIKFIGLQNVNSRDLMLLVEGAESLFVRDVEESDGMNMTRGCYQRVKNVDDDIIMYLETALHIDVMLMQFHFVQSTELLLVQNVWHTANYNGRIAIVYKRSWKNALTEEDLQPAVDLITKINGKPQLLEFCSEYEKDSNDLPPFQNFSNNVEK